LLYSRLNEEKSEPVAGAGPHVRACVPYHSATQESSGRGTRSGINCRVIWTQQLRARKEVCLPYLQPSAFSLFAVVQCARALAAIRKEATSGPLSSRVKRSLLGVEEKQGSCKAKNYIVEYVHGKQRTSKLIEYSLTSEHLNHMIKIYV
jgi:hypothetical protein